MEAEVKVDYKALVVRIAKEEGLDIAEDAVQSLQNVAFKIIDEVIKLTPNNYDDMIWMALKGKADEVLDGLIDKIDGKVDA